MDQAVSRDGVLIRLTVERWFHIVENHDDLAGYYDAVLDTITDPEIIIPGHNSSLIAVRNYGKSRYLHVIYRQVSREDGFVITAYFSRNTDRKEATWKRP